MWHAKPCDNILPNELFYILVLDYGKGFRFDSLGKIISSDKEPFAVPGCFGEWSDNIQPPLCKTPRTRKGVEGSPWLMDVWGISLALIALFGKLLGRFLHDGPPVPLSKSSM